MKNRLYLSIVLLVFSVSFTTAQVTTNLTKDRSACSVIDAEVDWPQFMADKDMYWEKLPEKWFEAPFLGNGEQGTLMYKLDKRTLRWDVGCSSAHDHRPMNEDDITEKNAAVLNRGRHFIGHLRLELPEDITGGTTHLSLWNADATGTLTSDGGTVEWTTMVHATEPVMRFDLTAKGKLKGASYIYVAEDARSPRAVRAKTLPVPLDELRVPANPAPVLSVLDDGIQIATHNLYAGGQTAVAWLQKEVEGTTRLWLSVQHSYPDKEAINNAIEAVRHAAATDQATWVQTHRDWWHDYYPQSFVSVGDAYWDSFYWIQQYKLACATRDKGWVIDNQGPWLQPTAWSATWWNLNAQLSHSGGYTANRRGMVSAMSHRLDINRDNLALNVAEPYRADSYAIGRSTSGWDLLGMAGEPNGRKLMDENIGRETGNLLWAIHNIDMEYRYWQDLQLRDEVLYPLLTRAVNYYRHFLVENDEGQLSLPETYSPEYRRAVDCTYDLDLLRWGVERLLELADEKDLVEKDEPLISSWKEIQEKLIPVHVDDKTGRMIGRDVKLTGRHRHWSHLMAVYPLRTLTPENSDDRELIDRSLTHWHSFGRAMGYSFTGGACIAALLGEGNRALGYLNGLKSFLTPNTFYSEIGLPVMETPLHGATAMQEMLLQSWGGVLRVFPAMPAKWSDAQFYHLRGEGAYLVSASREKGETKWVLVKSEVGGNVDVSPQLRNAQWVCSDGVKVSNKGNGVYSMLTEPGDWVMFWPNGGTQPKPTIISPTHHSKDYHFGLH